MGRTLGVQVGISRPSPQGSGLRAGTEGSPREKNVALLLLSGCSQSEGRGRGPRARKWQAVKETQSRFRQGSQGVCVPKGSSPPFTPALGGWRSLLCPV